ncbi:DUF6502 family protein [Curvibacter lanceolatus]|uniref:DUF6502 family protein n=1 Tax=Curvibacter lanceolatus TaxID=86182 RepID=UPI002356392C|nr:DUF6502 family protein [Curvibacter lanceolatus]
MSDPNSSNADAAQPPVGLPEPERAAQALQVVLRPLARLMIDNGLQLGPMVELLKKALVDESVRAYALEGKASTDSRISVLTGVHRKDVKRLRDEPSVKIDDVPIATQVVSRWISDPRYLTAEKLPRQLPRTARMSSVGEPDFTTLVAEVSKDVGARAILEELERLGVVDVNEDGVISLRATAFVPEPGLDDAFHFLAQNLGAHLSTAAHNLAPRRKAPPMLEQSAFSLDLTEAQANDLHRLARRLWKDDLQEFLQAATVAELRSEDTPGPKHRVRFGVYFHDEQLPDSEAPAPGDHQINKRTRNRRGNQT